MTDLASLLQADPSLSPQERIQAVMAQLSDIEAERWLVKAILQIAEEHAGLSGMDTLVSFVDAPDELAYLVTIARDFAIRQMEHLETAHDILVCAMPAVGNG